MSWEHRNRSNHYFYSGRKVQGVVLKEYLGCGIAAALIAAALLKQKEHRNVLWKNRRDLLHSLRVTNRLIRSFFRFSWQFERLLRFIARNAQEGILQRFSQEREYSTSMIQATVIPMFPDIDKTLARAKQGDPEALPQLIAQKPALKQHVIDLARQAQENQLHALAGEDQQLKAAILSQFNALKNELGDGSSNALEQLLIERILISWLCITEGSWETSRVRLLWCRMGIFYLERSLIDGQEVGVEGSGSSRGGAALITTRRAGGSAGSKVWRIGADALSLAG